MLWLSNDEEMKQGLGVGSLANANHLSCGLSVCVVRNDQDWPIIDSMGHVTRCLKYEQFRHSRDIKNNQEDLCKYFQDVIKFRNEAQQEWMLL